MIKSMTGYGKQSFENENFALEIEVKSLNSKFLDANVRLPKAFADKDYEVRNLLSKVLQRGKVNFNIDYRKKDIAASKMSVDKVLFNAYYKELNELANATGNSSPDIFRLALQMPDVISSNNASENKEEEWLIVADCINQAIAQCDVYRNEEGETLLKSIKESINIIFQRLAQIEVLDPIRIRNLKARIKGNLAEIIEKGKFDENRFEQELIFYIEKLDINEEKVRLKTHLNYFLDTLKLPESQGKKLGFITQEIGREINTIGSKANDADIQKSVVDMKEELEKIKEQMNNIL